MNETDLMHEIMLELSKRGMKVIRANVGKVKLRDGRWFNTGLPKGYPDLTAFDDKGNTYFIEVKTPDYHATAEQLSFLELMRSRGFAAGVVYSVAEALELCGYGS